MKVINLDRGKGKTTRLLYASEFRNIPILCANKVAKQHLIDKAEKLDLKIPEPITVSDVITEGILKTKLAHKNILIDETPAVLQCILGFLGLRGVVEAITLTEEDED